MCTHRQTLAKEIGRKLKDKDFVCYLDEQGSLADRGKYPRVICQLESMHRLLEGGFRIPQFDLIVIDEVESVLRHLSSATMGSSQASIGMFEDICRSANRGVLAMDAFIGPATADVLNKMHLRPQVVINKQRKNPRNFAFTEDEEDWLHEMSNDIKEGNNVVSPCCTYLHDHLKVMSA